VLVIREVVSRVSFYVDVFLPLLLAHASLLCVIGWRFGAPPFSTAGLAGFNRLAIHPFDLEVGIRPRSARRLLRLRNRLDSPFTDWPCSPTSLTRSIIERSATSVISPSSLPPFITPLEFSPSSSPILFSSLLFSSSLPVPPSACNAISKERASIL